jgi:hypothetical protein
MYYVRKKIDGSSWDFYALNYGEFSRTNAQGFRLKLDAVQAWHFLSELNRELWDGAYIIGPRGGCYDVSSGRRLRKDPEGQ